MNRDLHKEAFGLGQILSKHYFYLHTYISFGRGEWRGHRQGEELEQGHRTTLDIEPPHASCFSFQWCHRPNMAPDSGPHQDWLLLMAQSVISQKFCYCCQGIFIFLGQSHVRDLLTAGDDCTLAARPSGGRCGASSSGNR